MFHYDLVISVIRWAAFVFILLEHEIFRTWSIWCESLLERLCFRCGEGFRDIVEFNGTGLHFKVVWFFWGCRFLFLCGVSGLMRAIVTQIDPMDQFAFVQLPDGSVVRRGSLFLTDELQEGHANMIKLLFIILMSTSYKKRYFSLFSPPKPKPEPLQCQHQNTIDIDW